MRVLVFDPGYGDIKCALVNTSAQDMKIFKIPTLVTQVTGGLDFGNQSKEIVWNGKRWLVGEEAVRVGQVRNTSTDEFCKEHLPLLLGRALLEVGEVDEVVMAVSLYDWPRRGEFEKAVKKVVVNDRSFEHRVRLIPQGYGIWLESLAPGDGIVVDIGFRTVDVLVFVGGKPDGLCSFGVAVKGMEYPLSRVLEALPARVRAEFLPGEVALFLQKKDPFFRKLGLKEKVDSLIEEWSADLWSELMSRKGFEKVMVLLGRMLIAGGGARFFERPDPEKIPEVVELQILKDEPEFANVRGFARSLLEGGGEEK